MKYGPRLTVSRAWSCWRGWPDALHGPTETQGVEAECVQTWQAPAFWLFLRTIAPVEEQLQALRTRLRVSFKTLSDPSDRKQYDQRLAALETGEWTWPISQD